MTLVAKYVKTYLLLAAICTSFRLFNGSLVTEVAYSKSAMAAETSTAESNIGITFEPTTGTDFVNTSREMLEKCQGNCSEMPAQCFDCAVNSSCIYGSTPLFDCQAKDFITCKGNRTLQIKFQCRYCFLTVPIEEHKCIQTVTNCSVRATPQIRVKGECQVNDFVFCLGNRTFSKMMPCSWTSGYSWSTALALSITVGGFGVDRFYLGYWKEALGKFFSFGGLGVWTIIDVLLIATGYLSPSDGSLYVQ